MCGRYRLTRSDKELAAEFGLPPDADYAVHYNIAPTQMVPVLELGPLANGSEVHPSDLRQLDGLRWRSKRWGLIPFWSKDVKIGASMINARSETVLEKPALAESFRKHRVLVPADGFYEWKKMQNKAGSKMLKQPLNFGMKDGSTFCFAGIAAKWKSPEGGIVESCSILTTSANQLVADAHDRMPVILPRTQYARWLTTEPERAEQLLELLVPFDADAMKRYPVSQLVNSVKNDGPECIEPMSEDPTASSKDALPNIDEDPQGALFRLRD